MLEVFVFDPKMRTQSVPNPYFDQCYTSWKEIWKEEYQRIDPNHVWSSDTFTRQSSVVAIFYNKTFAASVLYRTLDLRSEIDRDDSFLGYWPKEVVGRVAAVSPEVLVCTSYTVAKDFRKNQIENYSMKDILAALTIHYFKKSGFPVSIGLTRNTRKVNEYMSNVGWESLGTIDFKDEPSEMFICKANSPSKIPLDLEKILDAALADKSVVYNMFPAKEAA